LRHQSISIRARIDLTLSIQFMIAAFEQVEKRPAHFYLSFLTADLLASIWQQSDRAKHSAITTFLANSQR